MEAQKQFVLILCNTETNIDINQIQKETGFIFSPDETNEEKLIFKLTKSNPYYNITNPIYLSINLIKEDKYMFKIGNYIELYETVKKKTETQIMHFVRCDVDSFDFLKSVIKSCLSKYLKKEE